MKFGRMILLITVILFISSNAPAQEPDYLKAGDENMAKWKDMRFGLFVHWGPVSLKGTEIGWSRGGERRGRGGTGTIPAEEYDNLYKTFDPVKFDAAEWVEIAKAAGMKYIVFTSKHHDGFSMFDSGATDYKITSPESPFGRDIAKELADACHEGGLKLGYYYSPVDWYHPDYRTDSHKKYINFMHKQVTELCTNYGTLDILWFDGLQIHPMSGSGGEDQYDPLWARDWDSYRLFYKIRQLQPNIIINNRGGLEGDFDTPEQHVGFYQLGRAWESCITICRQWAWKPDDRMKSLEECIQTLVTCAGGDGNFLLNVGPMPSGEIEPRQVERLKEIGAWLGKNGESIYGTRGGPVAPKSWGVTTQKGSTVYAHVMYGADPVIAVSAMNANVTGAALLDGTPVEFVSSELGTQIKMPENGRDEFDTVIVLTLDGKP